MAPLIPLWISAPLAGLVVMAVGGFVARRPLGDLKGANLAPERTIETLREDVAWAKEQAR